MNSECADRLSDVEELINNESALIKRNEELEKMLDKIVYGYEEGLAEDVKFHYKQITELLKNK